MKWQRLPYEMRKNSQKVNESAFTGKGERNKHIPEPDSTQCEVSFYVSNVKNQLTNSGLPCE